MAAKKKPAAVSSTRATSSTRLPGDTRPPRRLWVFVALDVLFAVVYFVAAAKLQSADGFFEALSATLGAAILVAGVGLVVRRPWGWTLSVAGCVTVLAGALLLLVLLGASIGYLWGTFGALGRGTAIMTIFLLGLVLEVYVLVPAFQLGFLLSARGRAALGRAPARAAVEAAA